MHPISDVTSRIKHRQTQERLRKEALFQRDGLMTADKAREISEAARKRIAELPNNVFHLTSK